MEIVTLILAIVGIIPTLILLSKWGIRYLLCRISWNEVYTRIDLFVQTFKNDQNGDPDTIITIGYGGTVIGAYLTQFFPHSQFIHIPVLRDAKTGIREFNRQHLYKSDLGIVLIASGVHETGLALNAIIENLRIIGVYENAIKSYAFLQIPQSSMTESHDRPATNLDYYSISKRRAKLPWYTARSPSTVTISRSDNRIPIITPKDFVDITNLSLDLHQSVNKVDLCSPLIMEILREYVISTSADCPQFNVVIGGPGAIGKSQFAITLAKEIQDSTYLPLDSSVLETAQRDKANLNGYQIEAYDLSLVQDWLQKLNDGKSFEVSPYDHSIRRCTGNLQVIGSSKVRIIEWVFALDSQIDLKKDIAIVIDAPNSARYQYLYQRITDLRKEKLTDPTLASIQQRYNSTAEQIDPTLSSFDVRFILDVSRRIIRIDSNVPELNRLFQQKF